MEVAMFSQRIQDLLQQMTLEEKIGQMIQIHPSTYEGLIGKKDASENFTGPTGEVLMKKKDLYNVGSFLSVETAADMIRIQSDYIKNHRLSIPLLFMYDIIHGYKTIFPINLALSASWNPEAAMRCARVASIEGSVSGQHVTFAPMVDLVRDPRWGRVMESPGEDAYLNGLMASATVKGFQTDTYASPYSMVACTKHFAAYGAAEGGRDYNTVDISERWLREYYLPGYRAALEAGSSMIMTSFNLYDGIPASINTFLLQTILRKEWAYDKLIISDWDSIYEALVHGAATDSYDCAHKAITAGVDIEMTSNIYYTQLKNLVEDKTISIELLDTAVLRILQLKEDLGLFDNPYRFANEKEEKKLHLSLAHRAEAREVASETMVLLKNDNILPLSKTTQRIAVIGPHADSGDLLGWWNALGDNKDTVTLTQGIKNQLGPDGIVTTSKGCDIFTADDPTFHDAKKIAEDADVIILALGESQDMSGEGANRGNIQIPHIQQQLAQVILEINKPTVAVLFNGRPLDLEWFDANVPALIEAWFPGTEGGNAIADILFGDINPSGHLTMTFPRRVGQIPLYYNHFNTGRPLETEHYTYGKAYDPGLRYRSHYIDQPNSPLYPFGYGLSYTTFEYSNLRLSSCEMGYTDTITASIDVTNTGKFDGSEVVQLYIRDCAGSVARPVKELKGFEKIHIKKQSTVTVEFVISEEMLRFYTATMDYQSEPGQFIVMIGPNSATYDAMPFTLHD